MNSEKRLRNLLQLISSEGIVEVARRKDLDKFDKSSLLLITSLNAFSGSKHALEVLQSNTSPVEKKNMKKYNIRGASQANDLDKYFPHHHEGKKSRNRKIK